MRLAIKNTNVVLNMAISPGLILIPSNMIVLKKKVDEYNNVLTLATKNMKFGVNKDINYVKPAPPQNGGNLTETTSVKDIPPKPDDTVYLLGSAVTLRFMVARYVI